MLVPLSVIDHFREKLGENNVFNFLFLFEVSFLLEANTVMAWCS